MADSRSVHTVRWIRFFADKGHRILLVSHHVPGTDLHCEAHVVLSPRGPVPGTRILRNVLELRRALSRFRPDILHAHYINESGWLAALARYRPFVLTAWGSDVYVAPHTSALAHLLNPWAVRQADLVTADSRDQVACLERMGAARARVIGWGVDLAGFGGEGGPAFRRRHGIPGDRVAVLSPRRWLPNSNLPILLEAFARLKREGVNALLVLKQAPEDADPARRRIAAQIRVLGLEDSVLVVGELPDCDLPGLYEAADITVSICSSDGTPVSVLEAMAARSAVVAGDLPSLREWIEHGRTGMLVPIGDPEALGLELLRLAQNIELRRRLGHAARQVVEQRADRRRELLMMEKMYRQLARVEGGTAEP